MTDKMLKQLDLMQMKQIIDSECDAPHDILGPHRMGNSYVIQAFFPGAEKVVIRWNEPELQDQEMGMIDGAGYFVTCIPAKKISAYRYEITLAGGAKRVCGDAYRHDVQITKQDTDKFKHGIHYKIYEKLGAHPIVLDGDAGTYFAVWAPNAKRVSVVGDFNAWDGRIHQMRRLWDSGIFEIFIPDAKVGDNYKFEIKLPDNMTYLKADPYGNAAQRRPDSASVIADLSQFTWEDEAFLAERASLDARTAPISIYELYLGSFLEPDIREDYANYREIAPKLIEYVKEMGYTHVELMPVMEHPYDASWGYQIIGYYAPSARYGSPEDFMYFVNELHKAGIGVILDWAPAYFPCDLHGLSDFDGTCLYEHADIRQGYHPMWQMKIFNYGRPQVSNYLIANALFWVEKFHADGIRVAAVSDMLYLDWCKNTGEWVPNMYGGNENLEAIEMIKHLNSVLKKRNPGVLSIAEEGAAYPMITTSLDEGGLGFDLKWNYGFVNDYFDYIKYDPFFRSHHHSELTFSMIYTYSEAFILSFSHDHAVHGKATIIGKMPGSREQKFANLRLSYAYMYTHPGKKLLFMGQDMGEFDEWNEQRCVQWELSDVDEHAGIAKLVKDLNELYRSHKALHELDHSVNGFEWINSISSDESFLSYLRKGSGPEDVFLVIANFAGAEQEITTGVNIPGAYEELFNSDSARYGGSGAENGTVQAVEREWDDRPYSLTVRLAPVSLIILKPVN